MILTEIRDYIQRHGQVALDDLVNHFDTPASVIESMVAKWISRGMVIRQLSQRSCGESCNKCNPPPLVIYQWNTNTS